MSLDARDLSFTVGGKTLVAEVSFSLAPKMVTALVGPNGAGKTTLIRLLSGVLAPSAGAVTLDGTPLRRYSRLALARRLAVVPQASELPEGFRGHEIVAMGRTPHLGFLAPETAHDLALIEAAMRRTGTWEFRDRPVEHLSGGERQRLVLARALAQQPRFLLLDEPTTHLDLRYQTEILGRVRREAETGLGALVVLHDLNLAARACDRMLLLDRGRLVADGTAVEVLVRPLLERVYGTRADVFAQPESGLPVVLPRFD